MLRKLAVSLSNRSIAIKVLGKWKDCLTSQQDTKDVKETGLTQTDAWKLQYSVAVIHELPLMSDGFWVSPKKEREQGVGVAKEKSLFPIPHSSKVRLNTYHIHSLVQRSETQHSQLFSLVSPTALPIYNR